MGGQHVCQSAGGRDAVPGLESLINSVESWHCAKLVVKVLASHDFRVLL